VTVSPHNLDEESMKPVLPLRRMSVGACLSASLLLAACAGTQPAPREVPAPPVTSVAQADQMLASVARERAGIESRYAEREQVCYKKFFVNDCLDEAKERRRNALAAQRAIEVQADRFKRVAIVEERERQMAEAEKRYQEQEAKMAVEGPKPPRQPAPLPPPPKPSNVAQRVAERDARLNAEAANAPKDAEVRAEKVRAFEARKAEAAERQRRVAERLAERAAKAAKAAAESAEKAKQAAQPAAAK
jgi:colicin import membrane protein